VAASVKLSLANSVGAAAACLMAGLIGAIALTGRWPVDAPRTHVEAGGILSASAEQVRRVEIVEGERRIVLSREPNGGWLVNDAPLGAAALDHINTALRLLANAPPRRVLAIGEYDPGQLAEFGLDPPRFVVAVSEAGGGATRISFGEATPAQNAQYVQLIGRPELYLLPRDVGEEWQLTRDFAQRAPDLLLPVSIAQIWVLEIVSHGALYRFERDPSGLWFHHVSQHVHLPGGLVHRADPATASLIEAELAALDRVPVANIVARHPGAGVLDTSGLAHPAAILLLYSRDSAGPVARVEFGDPAVEEGNRYVRIQQSDLLAVVPSDAAAHLARLLQITGNPS
jgi:uncharacterized protein DUF4340